MLGHIKDITTVDKTCERDGQNEEHNQDMAMVPKCQRRNTASETIHLKEES